MYEYISHIEEKFIILNIKLNSIFINFKFFALYEVSL